MSASHSSRKRENMAYNASVDSGFQEPIDVPNQSSPLTTPILEHHKSGATVERMGVADLFSEQQLQQNIAQLKHQQQLQQQMLLEQFQRQQMTLAHEHEKQMQEQIKEYIEQHELEKQRLEREKLERDKLIKLKNKTADRQSAIASSAVKAKLHDFVKKREAHRQQSPPQLSAWMGQTSVDHGSPPQSTLSPPYPSLLKKYDDFPLRKTASEPNILKVRSALKQKLERRNNQSPMMRRRENLKAMHKRKAHVSIDAGVCSSSSPESGPNSPSGSGHGSAINGSSPSLHPKDVNTGVAQYPGPDLNLYTSPSMPNISMGRPPKSAQISGVNVPENPMDADLRTLSAAHYALPLTTHVVPSFVPYFPILPTVMDREMVPPGFPPAYMVSHLKALEEARTAGKTVPALPIPVVAPHYAHVPVSGITDAQAAQARLHRHRPLGRTQSAPLPLGNPLLQPQNLLLQQQQQQQAQSQSQDQKMFHIKQHIRQTVLQRTGSKNHMENVDEETEVKQDMRDTREQDKTKDFTAMDDSAQADVVPEHPESFEKRDLIKMRHRHNNRPLSRTQSSPLVTYSMSSQQHAGDVSISSYNFTTGLAYDTIMQKHQCTCGNNACHPEHAGRLQSIWSRLQETGLVSRCERVKSRKASLEELQSCHSELYCLSYGTNPLSRQKLDSKLLEALPLRFCSLPCGGIGVDSDTVWNDYHTANAARMAAGCSIELSMRVASGELKNGMAVVRPPGHHAESQQPMGFCYFNSVAVAAKQLQSRLKLERILIVDWDVHHGNATQQMFYDDPKVMYISLHRHDDGNFFPGTGSMTECGIDSGLGYNVNIAFSGGTSPKIGDAEYLAAFRTVVMPLGHKYQPEMVIVSAGFDAAQGHPVPLGGYALSSTCFGHMTKELMLLAGGKIALVLEGGYELHAICDAAEMCVKALLGDELPPLSQEEVERAPCKNAINTLESVINIQAAHWPCLERLASTINYSLIQAQKCEVEEADTVSALASLSMVNAQQLPHSEPMEEGV